MISFALNHIWQSTVFTAVVALLVLILRGVAAHELIHVRRRDNLYAAVHATGARFMVAVSPLLASSVEAIEKQTIAPVYHIILKQVRGPPWQRATRQPRVIPAGFPPRHGPWYPPRAATHAVPRTL